LKVELLQEAKLNFEESLLLIRKLENTSERIQDSIVAKIYLNLGIIASHQGRPDESVHFHERSLELKRNDLPEMHD